MQPGSFQSGSADDSPTIRVSPSAPGSFPPPGQPGFGAPQQYPGAGPQFAPPATAYGGPPPQGYPSQPGFPPTQPGWSAPPPGFSGPSQPGYGPPQGFASQPGFPPPGQPGGPRKKGKGRLIAIIAAVVVVVVVVGIVAAAALGGKKSPTTANNPGSTTTGSQPGHTPGAATATPTTPSTSGGAPTGYTKFNGGLYTIDYPQDWTLDPSGQEEGTSSFTGTQLQVLQVDVENVGDENTAQYLSLYCQTLGDTNPGSPTNVTIGGQQWQKLVCNVNGQPEADAAAVTYKGHIFTINTLSLDGTYATDETQYYQPMEQSFAFTS